MKKGIINIINMFFGKTPRIRFKRLIILILVLSLAIILIQNISFGTDEDGDFFFKWAPAADINITK